MNDARDLGPAPAASGSHDLPAVLAAVEPLEPVELELFGGHEQLEHEQAFALLAQVVRESLQPLCLSSIPRLIALRIVAHQHFAKRRVKGLDMLREVLAILEVEFSLTALLGGTGERIALGRRIAENGSTELLIDQDARFSLRYTGGDGGSEAVVDHLLGGGDLRSLVGAELPLEKHAAVEGEDIQRTVETHGRHLALLSFR